MKLNRALLILLVSSLIACNSSGDKRLVVSQVNSVSKLATVEYILKKYIFGQKQKKLWFIKLSEAEFVAETEARVKVGIDLSKIGNESVSINGDQVIVKLPPVEILNFSYPPDKFEVDPQLSSQKSKLSIEDIETFSRMAELEIRRDLHFLGMEKTAQERTRLFLHQLLHNMGYEDVVLEFENQSLEKAQYFQETLNEIRALISE